jgi:hypothetical protein
LAYEKIKNAEDQAEVDLDEFRDKEKNKPCSITVVVTCPPSPRFNSESIDFRNIKIPPGKSFPCGYQNTLRYKKGGSEWDKPKFNER